MAPTTDCDLWDGPLVNGYGSLTISGKTVYAHRIAWMQDNGHTDLNILHSCDTPRCVNVAHLRAGTQSENARDMYNRERHPLSVNGKCPAGHELVGSNLYVTPRGHRKCRECRRTRWRKDD